MTVQRGGALRERAKSRAKLPILDLFGALVAAAAVAACSANPVPETGRIVSIQRTEHGIAHIKAPDYESLAYGVAYAHAGDNVCQTADHLVSIRGERSRWFGPGGQALFGLRMLPNATIDVFVRSHMDDETLAKAQSRLSAEARDLAHGYVSGYNRYLAEHEGSLPDECNGEPWVRPMTDADYLRLLELTMVQLGVALMADSVVAAAPPAQSEGSEPPPSLEDAAEALAPFHFDESLLGSNGWAFGADATTNGRGLLLGNPHFPWSGVNRFWQMHLTVPGKLDVMGASIGHAGLVQIGFNDDVAWTHTVSTGRRFTLHELELVPGEPTSYLLDGEPVPMTAKEVAFDVIDEDGEVRTETYTVWKTRFGPVVEVPRAGLAWGRERAYALKDANAGNLRAMEIWVGFNRAESIGDMQETLARLGVPWVNTIAADRHGDALYADVSVVPDVDASQLARCAPSEPAAGLFEAGGLVVLDGSRSACDWNEDPDSPVPGILPIERMPVAVRRDWVQNSNDSFWLSNPAIEWPAFSPLIGGVRTPQNLRTRAGLYEIGARLAGRDDVAEHPKVGLDEVQAMLFRNRNHAAHVVLDDLLEICPVATTPHSREACAVLANWDRRDDLESRGAHLFREWWREARNIEGVWRVDFNPRDPLRTPAGLETGDPTVQAALFASLDNAVAAVSAAGHDLDAPLGELQRRETPNGVAALHGGMEFEGVLNKIETPGQQTIDADGYRIGFGTSYVQTVTFDDRGPLAEAILTYGQSSHPDSPYAFDQLSLYADKEWHRLPFHPDDIERQRVGEPLQLTVQ
jgi:acyl-homoserine-lactone acylase